MYCTTGIMRGISNVGWVTSHPTTIIVVIAHEASDRQGTTFVQCYQSDFISPRLAQPNGTKPAHPFRPVYS